MWDFDLCSLIDLVPGNNIFTPVVLCCPVIYDSARIYFCFKVMKAMGHEQTVSQLKSLLDTFNPPDDELQPQQKAYVQILLHKIQLIVDCWHFVLMTFVIFCSGVNVLQFHRLMRYFLGKPLNEVGHLGEFEIQVTYIFGSFAIVTIACSDRPLSTRHGSILTMTSTATYQYVLWWHSCHFELTNVSIFNYISYQNFRLQRSSARWWTTARKWPKQKWSTCSVNS